MTAVDMDKQVEAMQKIIDGEKPDEEEMKRTLEALEKEVLEIINTREYFEPLIFERYEEVSNKIENDPFSDIFEQVYALDPDIDVKETEEYKSGLKEFNESILNDWNFVKEHMPNSRFYNLEPPCPRHKELISTRTAVGTIISTKEDMKILKYSESEIELLYKLGMVMLRHEKLMDAIYRIGRIGKEHGHHEPGVQI
tara:strand:+ start:207 stop:797 length:591 start_codon:yes stop_codon:yes gene_type:complete